ncbi:MAG: putative sulfate exporter family transporter, partial [Chloroflexi bacterium]|nr:putative sulfate exporter family transporter [Chloroflexota bacterium]
LRLGIILLGLRLSLQDVVATGLSALLLIVACMAVALTLAFFAGRLLKIPPRLAALIGVGTAICGNTAIVAVAPVIEAKEEEVSFAVATITFFGTLAVVVYPLIGYFLGVSDRTFGLWAGTAVNDTSQVVAAGAAFSDKARDIATVVKLTRNTLMVPVMILIGLVYARSQRRSSHVPGTSRPEGGVPGTSSRVTFGKIVPWFVLGFLLMTLLRTAGVALGILPQDVAHPGALTAAASALKFVDEVARFAVLMALSAIGLGTDVEAVRRTGVKPFALGLSLASMLAVFSLGTILVMGMGR